MSVNKPDSDPPPAEVLGPMAAQRSRTPTERQAPIQPAPMLPPAPTPPAEAPFGQIPWMEGKQAQTAQPARVVEPARAEPEPRPNQPVAPRATNGASAEQPARRPSQRPRGPMKRTTTLIHGSMIQPDGSPAVVDPPQRAQAIDVEGESVPSQPSHQVPAPQGPSTALAVRTSQAPRPSVVTVASASAYWKPPVTRSPSPWLWTLRDELCAMAMERALGRCFVVMITSGGGARQAKSEAVAHLSLALAETGHPRILLMEGEFDRPAVHEVMGVEMPRSAGFSQQMHNRIHAQASGGWVVVECLPTLHVLAEGRVRSPGLLHSFQFEGAVTDLRQRYEIIVIDGPPLSVNTDMRALEAVVDGVIVVLRPGDREPTPVERALFGRKLLKIVTVDQPQPPNARS
jgi:Mrp family chromosome partitioning ATPase